MYKSLPRVAETKEADELFNITLALWPLEINPEEGKENTRIDIAAIAYKELPHLWGSRGLRGKAKWKKPIRKNKKQNQNIKSTSSERVYLRPNKPISESYRPPNVTVPGERASSRAQPTRSSFSAMKQKRKGMFFSSYLRSSFSILSVEGVRREKGNNARVARTQKNCWTLVVPSSRYKEKEGKRKERKKREQEIKIETTIRKKVVQDTASGCLLLFLRGC